MGMPNIPDIKPKIEICMEDTIALLLASIALEELSLAHIMNAEAEKIQEVIKDDKCNQLEDLVTIDKTVERMMRDVIKKEMLLEFKFENVLELMDNRKKYKKDCD